MRVAQIAPLHERVPPKLYGGTERVVHTLCEELVGLGHDVTLFASRDSLTSARLVPMVETGTRLGGARDPIALHIAMLEEVFQHADEFDVIHSHIDVLAFAFARASTTPTVSTMHGRLDFPEHARVLSRFRDLRLISISERQRVPVTSLGMNWAGTVHNGITLEHFPFSATPADPPYLAFLGRISPEKGPHHAIEIARRCGLPLKIAAKIDPADAPWARQHFLPLLDTPGVEFLDEVDEAAKAELLGGATALLFPIDWPEPFGIVLVESMACGTPVVALRGGSVEEVLADGVTGYVCSSLDEMVDAVHRVGQLERTACRRRVEERFSGPVMAASYERLYRQVLLSERLTRSVSPVLAADGPIGSLLPGIMNGDAAISDIPSAGEA
jgi:glycosyltransferase involved in cell wall biosynthesis